MSTTTNSPIAADESQAPAQPSFTWIAETGGPDDLEAGQFVEHRGVRWTPSMWNGQIFTFTHTSEGNFEHTIGLDPRDGRLKWQVLRMTTDAIWTLRSGKADTFDEAVSAALSAEPVCITLAGREWFECSSDSGVEWVTEVEGQPVSVYEGPHSSWLWLYRLPLSSAEGQLCKLISISFSGFPELHGVAASLDEAAQDALESPARLKLLVRQVTGGDAYEAGHRDGIEAAKRALDRLQNR